MPIYEYRCEACGHTLDALQRLSDAPLKDCPECDEAALKRLMSAPAFRLKGGGWYETDFKSDKEKKRNLVEGSSAASKQDGSSDGAKADGASTAAGKSADGAKSSDGNGAAKESKGGAKATAAKDTASKTADKTAEKRTDRSASA